MEENCDSKHSGAGGGICFIENRPGNSEEHSGKNNSLKQRQEQQIRQEKIYEEAS
jgi:hypothetical protein